ncbi:hypothetical protein CA603_45185 [Paraburkholderia hospita]|nr:hypothetical protein CA603_45185 [Paraburkholderia hospita]
MGASDGFIVGLTKLVDHGPPTSRWNLVIIAEGYQIGEMPKFHQDANVFVDALFHTPPFDERWCAINIYRLDVASNDSGADDPAGGGCTGTGAVKNTYFDATFCSSGIPRLLTINTSLATTTVSTYVPKYHVIVAIVNSTIYGGGGASPGGPPVATYSLGVSSISGLGKEIAGIHELGHAGFYLGDEYPYGGPDHYASNVEPLEPNVTINVDKTTIKWKSLITAAQIPTTVNADCTKEDPQPNPVPAGTVGLFEGAKYSHCGVYRPAFNCRMRELASPFCPVCAQTIRDTLAPFMSPASVAPVSQNVDFHDIPEGINGSGVTTYRAAIFEVGSCSLVTLKVTPPGPSGGFSLPLGSVVTVNPRQIISEGRIWVAYTSTTAGSTATGNMTVQCVETGQTWVINISANTVARPKSAAVLVLDHSGSMSEDAGDGTTKVQKLREAVKTFVDAMLPGDGIGLVRFDDTAQIVMPIADAAVVGGNVKTLIDTSQFDPAGSTSIGDGLAKGNQSLGIAAGFAVKTMVVLTDGMENTPPWIAQETVTANTFAVGLGVPSDIDIGKLEGLTSGHQGYLLVSGLLTQDQKYRLQKFFLQILAGITNANIVLDPEGLIIPKSTYRIPFYLTEADYGADIILLSDKPRSIAFTLETPDGTTIKPASASPNIQFVVTPQVSFYRLGLPAIPKDVSGTHGGQWTAVLQLAGRAGASVERGLHYSLMVHSYSSLTFRAFLAQPSFLPGAELFLTAILTEYEVPVEKRAKVWAEITRPDGTRTVVQLSEDEPGRFTGKTLASVVGLYVIRLRASGFTFAEQPFTREQTLTAAILAQEEGGTPQPPSDCGDLCKLFECLLRGKAIDAAVLRRYGIRWEVLVECLRECCGESKQISPPTQPAKALAEKPVPRKKARKL